MLRTEKPVQGKGRSGLGIIELRLNFLIMRILPELGLRRYGYAEKYYQPKKKQPVSHHNENGLWRRVMRC